ncbi:MAG: LPP20 family lipoprotein [Myxococcota bacterium]
MRWSLVLISALTLFPGCAKKAADSSNALGQQNQSALKGAPDWVMTTCKSWEGYKKKANPICAAGAVDGVSNIAMARDAAANRARVDISRQIETRVASMIKDYQSTAAAGVPLTDAMSDEQYITNVSKSISQASVSGAEIKEMWASDTGTIWVLVGVEFEKFADVVNQMNEMSQEMREHLRANAEREMADLDANTQ